MTEIAIGMLVFPRLTQLDLTAPYEVFSRIPGARVSLVGKTMDPVVSEFGLRFHPDVTFAEAPAFDVLFVPGGSGVDQAIQDEETIAFLAKQGESARYVTSVCTGALALGAAGLLEGYRATTHWLSIDLLPSFGAIAVSDERVVTDRNRVTGGGVTAGIDFALSLAAQLVGIDEARAIQLMIEYAPAPPFQSGRPDEALAATTDLVRGRRAAGQASRATIVAQIAALRRRPTKA